MTVAIEEGVRRYSSANVGGEKGGGSLVVHAIPCHGGLRSALPVYSSVPTGTSGPFSFVANF